MSAPPLPHGAKVVVVSGPGGVGKGTLVELLLSSDPHLWLSRSWTTRDRRPGAPADAYRFVTADEFGAPVAAGGFLEWVEFLDYRQGSPVPTPPEGSDVLFEIDVKGARRIKELYPDALLVFVDAPSREEQAARMRGRGDAPERVAQRVEKAAEEAVAARDLGMHLLVNDDLDRALAALRQLIDEHRAG
ncbi:MAG: guanylate kinase [Actinomycetes bacterium]